jgi:hypothetical protein
MDIRVSNISNDEVVVGDEIEIDILPHRFPNAADTISFDSTYGMPFTILAKSLKGEKFKVLEVKDTNYDDVHLVVQMDGGMKVKVYVPEYYGDKDYTLSLVNKAVMKFDYVEKCTCTSYELFHFGCKCGQFKREQARKK